ncbi:MAG: hypothetical protein AAF108_10050 [Planctomycetota bacterium]
MLNRVDAHRAFVPASRQPLVTAARAILFSASLGVGAWALLATPGGTTSVGETSLIAPVSTTVNAVNASVVRQIRTAQVPDRNGQSVVEERARRAQIEARGRVLPESVDVPLPDPLRRSP